MIENKLPGSASPALARFADILCMYNLELFTEQLKSILMGPPSPLDERTIMFRLAEHAVHVCAVGMLESQNRKADAEKLRVLPPITDQTTARAAKLVADCLEEKPIRHARGAAHFAACDESDTTAVGRAAEHAAYAVAESADSYTREEDSRRVYDAAAALLTMLRTGSAVARVSISGTTRNFDDGTVLTKQ
jgi:hypothetical protein